MALDELTRQKKLQSLSRKPAQENSEDESDNSSIDDVDSVEIVQDALDVSDEVPAPSSAPVTAIQTQKPSEEKTNDNTAQTIGRLAVGATPALFSFLFGPQQAERGMAQSQKFFAAGKPSKLVPIVGPSGEAIYETPEGAVGKKVYQKPTAKGEMAKPEYKTYYDTITKKPVYGAIDRSGNVTVPGSMESLNEYIKSGRLIPAVETTEFDKTKEASGLERSVPREKFGTPAQPGKVTATTTASQYGLSEGDFNKGNDLIKTVSTRKAKIDDQNRIIDKAYSLLNAATKDSIVQAAGVFKTAKIVTEEKISDPERESVTQEAGLLSRLADRLQTNITGEQRQSIINQMKTILTKIKEVNGSSKENLNDEAINMFASASFNENDKKNKIKFMSSQLRPESVVKTKQSQPSQQKPKKIKQDGHVYILNERTGKYE